MAGSIQGGLLDDLRQELLLRFLVGTILFGLAVILMAEAQSWPISVGLFGLFLMVVPVGLMAIMARWPDLARWLFVVSYMVLALVVFHWLGTTAFLATMVLIIGAAVLLADAKIGFALAMVATFHTLVFGSPAADPGGLTRFWALATTWAAAAGAWFAISLFQETLLRYTAFYIAMRSEIEAIREQQLDLKQTRDDLVQANLNLARLTKRLGHLQAVADEARRAKEEFVANVSHELRTPLNMIIGFSEMIVNAPNVYTGRLPAALLADIDIIYRNGQHLASLINDILDLSQIEMHRTTVSRSLVNLHDTVEEAMVAVKPLFDSKGLYLVQEIAEPLPPVWCDGTRIRQVILNLLSNAGRFTRQGGVTIRARQENQAVVVSVADTGSGIQEADQSLIFEPFRQLNKSLLRKQDGTGLGLAISKGFVEIHGGRMWLESQVGAGSTFHFCLPLADEPIEPPSIARYFNPYAPYEPRTGPSRAPHPVARPRFLVLEQATAAQDLLRHCQHDVEIVGVRDRAGILRELAQTPAHALIVNDASAAQMAGDMQWLHELPYRTPAIVCHVRSKEEAAQQLGVARYLVKPTTRKQVLEALASLNLPLEKVLVVDDDPDMVQLLCQMLATSPQGYRVLRALDATQALTLLREHRPDAVLLDLVMPEVDGHFLLGEKQRDPRLAEIPTIIISAQDPVEQPLDSTFLHLTRGAGLSASDLLHWVQTVSGLNPSSPAVIPQAQPGIRSG